MWGLPYQRRCALRALFQRLHAENTLVSEPVVIVSEHIGGSAVVAVSDDQSEEGAEVVCFSDGVWECII